MGRLSRAVSSVSALPIGQVTGNRREYTRIGAKSAAQARDDLRNNTNSGKSAHSQSADGKLAARRRRICFPPQLHCERHMTRTIPRPRFSSPLCSWLHWPKLHAEETAPLGVGKPNFIIINIDDMGYADIGLFGSN